MDPYLDIPCTICNIPYTLNHLYIYMCIYYLANSDPHVYTVSWAPGNTFGFALPAGQASGQVVAEELPCKRLHIKRSSNRHIEAYRYIICIICTHTYMCVDLCAYKYTHIHRETSESPLQRTPHGISYKHRKRSTGGSRNFLQWVPCAMQAPGCKGCF